ncbi:MAG: hypothetical protein P8Z00_24325, partial [Anaerolineales bacterium]
FHFFSIISPAEGSSDSQTFLLLSFAWETLSYLSPYPRRKLIQLIRDEPGSAHLTTPAFDPIKEVMPVKSR